METQRFRLPLGEYREPHDAESHLGWCVWLPPRPPFKFPCAPSELDERRPTAGWSREREREQKECVTAESGRNGAKSGSRPHLMKRRKYNTQLPLLRYLFFLCHTHTHLQNYIFNSCLSSFSFTGDNANVETCQANTDGTATGCVLVQLQFE